MRSPGSANHEFCAPLQVGNGWYESFEYRHYFSGLTCEGAVLAEGPLDAVSADPKVIEVYLGR